MCVCYSLGTLWLRKHKTRSTFTLGHAIQKKEKNETTPNLAINYSNLLTMYVAHHTIYFEKNENNPNTSTCKAFRLHFVDENSHHRFHSGITSA